MLSQYHREHRRDYARILLGLHNLGYHLIFIDEHSTHSKDVSPYGWFKPH